MRIISAKREFSAIAQRDRDGVEAGNIVKPAIRRQVNAPAIPPTNANGLTSGNLRKPHSLANNANTKRGRESFSVDCDPEFVEQDEANQQDDRNDRWRLNGDPINPPLAIRMIARRDQMIT